MKAQDIGGIFLKLQDDLRKYIPYSANQSAANDTIVRLTKTSQEFNAYVACVQAKKESKNLGLDSLLIKPFQRVCRYPLLLKELLKATPSGWSVRDNITKAIEVIDVLVKEANDSKRQTDNLVEVMELQNRFVISPNDTELLTLHKKHFMQEGACKLVNKKKSKPGHLVLFSEIVIIAVPKK